MPTRGLFRLIRQPIYLAFALTLWTVPTITPGSLAVAVVLTAYCMIGPMFKEARFVRRYGSDFTAQETLARRGGKVRLRELREDDRGRAAHTRSPDDSARLSRARRRLLRRFRYLPQ